ncbi:hypothetical protein UK15_36450 [Streptomyces variegatus]|uniref:Uncharacterized protein n=1 Tax=Streptomyces variegatus TaxID=284040 RepID=A0A0M2GFW4_9ACTN|nr:hypothetical protein UK15_36450 [Streptomyces variegatus]
MAQEVRGEAFYARDLAGTVVLVGVPTPEMKLELPLLDLFGRGGALKSSWYGDCLPSRDFPMLINLYLQGRLPLDRFVGRTETYTTRSWTPHSSKNGHRAKRPPLRWGRGGTETGRQPWVPSWLTGFRPSTPFGSEGFTPLTSPT